jgi:hypothetical protein
VLAYYLANQQSVETYLAEQGRAGADLQARIEQDSRQMHATTQLRRRIQQRFA